MRSPANSVISKVKKSHLVMDFQETESSRHTGEKKEGGGGHLEGRGKEGAGEETKLGPSKTQDEN